LKADDDRETAEAFGEAGQDDRETADLPGSVGVAPDGVAGHAGQDADADAGADDAESRQACSDVFH